ncbi:MAG: DUF6776 family protein [Pseudomonadota bacterium]
MRLLLLGLVLAVAYLLFEFGRIQAGYNVLAAAAERADFNSEIAALEDEIGGLEEQIVMLETEAGIERAAYKSVELSLSDLEAKIQEQRDAIAFYRGIVSPSDGNAGLRVQDLKLARADRERAFSIRLVLVQAMKHDRKVSGDVLLTIDGVENGEPKSYRYTELLPEDAEKGWAFSFRYFQDFDREVILPDGFTPESVTVAVNSRTRSIASIEQSFSWDTNLG